MRILLSNDDGIGAHGFTVLEKIAAALSDDVWVAAPETEQSGAGHSLTLVRPLRVRHINERRLAIDGTPTDCVLLALNDLFPDLKPDLLLSGVNRGSNLADDVTYSGTIAAAMEATLLGVPAIALSQHYKPRTDIDWDAAETHAPALISRLVAAGWPDDVLINLNFPGCSANAVQGTEVVRQGRFKAGDALTERIDPRGRPYYWIGETHLANENMPGTDVEAIERDVIAVTPLCLDLTHKATSDRLSEVLG